MRYLDWGEVWVSGPKNVAVELPIPGDNFQDVAVLAFPVPAGELEGTSHELASVTGPPGAKHLGDRNPETAFEFPTDQKPFTLTIRLREPAVVRSIRLVPAVVGYSVSGTIEVADSSGSFKSSKGVG